MRIESILCAILTILNHNTDAKLSPRIIGGRPIDSIQDHPYQALILTTIGGFAYDVGYYQCGGAIISHYHVITAAHCLRYSKSPKDCTVYTGSSWFKAGASRSVQDYYVHPDYESDGGGRKFYHTNNLHDVAVIKLKKPINYNKYEKPIALASAEPTIGANVVLTGWGLIDQENRRAADHLNKAHFEIISRSDCRKKYRNLLHEESILCAVFARGVGACMGDSGGPLVMGNELVGVLSMGDSSCASGFPDIYTNVHRHVDFIRQTVAPEKLVSKEDLRYLNYYTSSAANSLVPFSVWSCLSRLILAYTCMRIVTAVQVLS